MATLELARAQITPSGDTLTIELSQPNETPAVILFRWPAAPTVSDPATFPRSPR